MNPKPKSDNSKNDNNTEIKTALFYKYILPNQDLVVKICNRYSIPRWEAEDDISEALINLYKYIQTYDTARAIRTWIYAVTIRLVYEQNQKRMKYPIDYHYDMNEIAGNFSFWDVTSEKSMSIDNYRSFYNDHILHALDQLSENNKLVLLYQIIGFTHKEIMEITYNNGTLKKPNLATVRSRKNLAHKQLQTLLPPNQ